MAGQFHKVPADLWLEIASYFSSANERRNASAHTPWHTQPFRSGKVDHNLVNLSSSCRFLRKVLQDEVTSYLCLNLMMKDGELFHIVWPNQRESTFRIGRHYSLDMIPTGPHIRRLYVRVQVMLDRNPRKATILDKVPGSLGRHIRRIHDRIRPPKFTEFDLSTNYYELKTQAMEWTAPFIDTMPNIQTLQLQAFVTPFISGSACDIGPRCMDALARLKNLENLHLGRMHIPEYHGTLSVVRLTMDGDAPSLLRTFPYLKDLRYQSSTGYPHGWLVPLDVFKQLEALHCCFSDQMHVNTFHESCLALSRMKPQPKFALREIVIDARTQDTDVTAIIEALAFANLTVFVFTGDWVNVRGYPRISAARELAMSTWPGLTICLIGHDIDD